MRHALRIFEKIVDRLTTVGVLIGGIFTGVMTIIVSYAVVARYVFNRPIGWSEEIATYMMVWSVFLGAAYTLKDGKVVVKDGKIEATPMGRTYWVNAKVPADIDSAMNKDTDIKFRKYNTVSKSNYMVEDSYLPNPVEIRTEGAF